MAGWAFFTNVQAATFEVGDVVDNFTLYARTAFTGADGQPVAPGDPVSLHDFEGKIVFVEFFWVW